MSVCNSMADAIVRHEYSYEVIRFMCSLLGCCRLLEAATVSAVIV